MAQGVLTGKYLPGQAPPRGAIVIYALLQQKDAVPPSSLEPVETAALVPAAQ